jgi:hypothetical protein
MKEPTAASWTQGPLMVGPDSAVYVICGEDRAVNRLPESFGSLTSAGRPAVKGVQVRADLRQTLENLPHMGVVRPC